MQEGREQQLVGEPEVQSPEAGGSCIALMGGAGHGASYGRQVTDQNVPERD